MNQFLGLVLGLACIIGSAHGAAIYVYENLSGDRLITDHPRSDLKGYKLVKQYGVDDYFGLPTSPATTRRLEPRASQYDDLIVAKARKGTTAVGSGSSGGAGRMPLGLPVVPEL